MVSQPWESLRFISKIEIVPGNGETQVRVRLDEDVEYDSFYGSAIRVSNVVARNRSLRLSNETVNMITDFPDDFKKLTAHFEGDKAKAYEIYQSLNKPVPDDWDKVPEELSAWADGGSCDCCGEYDE